MLLIIDNYDSFTYNLVQYFGELGAEPVVKRNDEISLAEIEALRPEAIVISPGPCTPKEAGISNEVIAQIGPHLPVLGVCLGHQCIGHVYGGAVVRAGRLMHGKTSPILHDGSGVFAGLPSPLTATRYHSLCLDPATIPATLRVTARSEDGVVQGVVHRHRPVHGVQFHPESVLSQSGEQIVENFLSQCHD